MLVQMAERWTNAHVVYNMHAQLELLPRTFVGHHFWGEILRPACLILEIPLEDKVSYIVHTLRMINSNTTHKKCLAVCCSMGDQAKLLFLTISSAASAVDHYRTSTVVCTMVTTFTMELDQKGGQACLWIEINWEIMKSVRNRGYQENHVKIANHTEINARNQEIRR